MKLLPSLTESLTDWAQRQPVFLTASAPTHGPHVNVSPKGLADSHFAILGPNQCAYIDRTGSGCETISHSYENGRLCLMFMSFGNTPRIMRLFCRSTVVEYDQPEFQRLVQRIAGGKREVFEGARAVILCDIWQVQTSCGYGVPRVKSALYKGAQTEEDEADGEKRDTSQPSLAQVDLEQVLRNGQGYQQGEKLDELAIFEERPTLDTYWINKTQQNKAFEYQRDNNTASLDGLPGLRAARKAAGEVLWVSDAQARAKKILSESDAVVAGFLLAVALYVMLRCAGLLL